MYIVCSKIEVNGSRNANWEQGGGQKLLDGQVNGKMQNGKIRIDRFEISNVLKSQKMGRQMRTISSLTPQLRIVNTYLTIISYLD